MKITVNSSNLYNAVNSASGIVEKRSSLKILQSVLLTVKDGLVSVTSTDIDNECEINCDADIITEGSAVIHCANLLSILKACKATIEITKTSPSVVEIKYPDGKSTLPCDSEDCFPIMPIGKSTELAIPSQLFLGMINSVYASMANDDVRYCLNGSMLMIDADKITLTATDGHRLSTISEPLTGVHSDMIGKSLILRRKSVLELRKLLKKRDATMQLLIGQNQVQFKIGEVYIVSKLIDGQYPDYQRVIPRSLPFSARIVRSDLANSLKRNAKSIKESIRFEFGPTNLKLGFSTSEEEIKTKSNADLTIGFSQRYVADILSMIDSSEIDICAIDPNSPSIWQSANRPNAIHVLMPHRL